MMTILKAAQVQAQAQHEEFVQKTVKPIQLNVMRNLRSWMRPCWEHDFEGNDKVQRELRAWIRQMKADAKHMSRSDIERILATFVQMQILREQHRHERVKALRQLRNYDSLCVVFCALGVCADS